MRTLLFAVSITCCSVLLAQHNSEEFKSAIEKARFLVKAHQKMTRVPGAQVAVMVDGKLVWSEGFGYGDLQDQSAVTPETKFRIASISKSVTSMALGKLIETNELDIDEDIRSYVPEFPEKAYTISARQLAASVAGIRHYNNSDPRYHTKNYPSVVDAIQVFANDPLKFEPNTDYLYSSFGWVLLSAVMERAADRSFFDLMEGAWREMGMSNTSFDYPNKVISDKSSFYVLGKKDQRMIAPEEDRSYMYAGGGYLSTAEDLVKMGHQLITDQFISAQTRKALTSSHVLANGDSKYYGLGWETGRSRLDVPVIFHGGSMQSARSHLIIYPEQKVVFAYLSNTGDQVFFNDREAQSIAEIFVEKHVKNDSASSKDAVIGKWEITTTSLRGKSGSGTLSIHKKDNGIVSGTLTFTRSKKKGNYPVILTSISENSCHLIAVSPMFIDLYVEIDESYFSGKWLHDFNTKGIPEPDPYWKARVIEGKRID